MDPSSPPVKRTLHLLRPPDISSANDTHKRINIKFVNNELVISGLAVTHQRWPSRKHGTTQFEPRTALPTSDPFSLLCHHSPPRAPLESHPLRNSSGYEMGSLAVSRLCGSCCIGKTCAPHFKSSSRSSLQPSQRTILPDISEYDAS